MTPITFKNSMCRTMMNTYSDSRGNPTLMEAQHKAMSATLADLGLLK